MATLKQMPHQSIIDGFKGVLDFYEWKGIPCVRKWPVWKPRDPTPPEKVNQDAFSYINKAWKALPANIKTAWNDMARQTSLTGKDHYVRAYMTGRD